MKTKKLEVIIPEDNYTIINFNQDDLPGVGVINKSLKSFNPKEIFAWHCSIMFHFTNTIENAMPSEGDRILIENIEDSLDKDIKGKNIKKPNALFLGRITWNGTRELIWRVYDPKITNKFLEEVIKNKKTTLPFDYRIDSDPEWKLAKWHLNNC